MANTYHAHDQHGRVHTVDTPHHHSNHSDSDFKKLLGQALQGAVSGISNAGATIVITKFVLKKL